MGQLVIVNAPSMFTAIWTVMKRWLSQETIDKVQILGSNYQSTLFDLADPENLPESLGGTCTCAEFGGCSLSGAGPWLDGRKGWGPKAKALQQQEETVERSPEVPTSNPEVPASDPEGSKSAVSVINDTAV